ncbi:MAG: mechanosensitive ion channel [Paludibacter sp.]|nr:mechanosensitive ion channel [Paludibacter sp.]
MIAYLPQIIGTLITFVVAFGLKIIIRRLVQKYGRFSTIVEARISQINRILSIFINLAAVIILIVIWGVDTRNLFVALSSVFAVIGVALFAQWSILSNITAGIIIYFSAPFKIGDYIRIIDKDMPIEARIEDIFTFYTHLRTKDGGIHIFPNALLLQKAISVLASGDENFTVFQDNSSLKK